MHKAIEALNISHVKNVRTSSIMNRTLHHKNIWDYATTAVGGMLIFSTIMLAIKLKLNSMKQNLDHKDLQENRVVNIKYYKSSTKFEEFLGKLDDKTKRVLLLATQLGGEDARKALYENMIKVAKEQNIGISKDDLPEMITDQFDSRAIAIDVDGINKMVQIPMKK